MIVAKCVFRLLVLWGLWAHFSHQTYVLHNEARTDMTQFARFVPRVPEQHTETLASRKFSNAKLASLPAAAAPGRPYVCGTFSRDFVQRGMWSGSRGWAISILRNTKLEVPTVRRLSSVSNQPRESQPQTPVSHNICELRIWRSNRPKWLFFHQLKLANIAIITNGSDFKSTPRDRDWWHL